MAVRDIVMLGDPVLRREADEVTSFGAELEALVRDMFETMYHADGIGLAAPQIGLSQRIIVVDLRREEEPQGRVAIVNPRIVWSSPETDREPEGCLSMPGLEDVVERAVAIRVEGVDPAGKPLVIEADQLFARALQHEIDHVDGRLFLDRVTPMKRRMLLKKWKKLREDAS